MIRRHDHRPRHRRSYAASWTLGRCAAAALLAAASLGAQAAPLVEARSTSFAQGSPQGLGSDAWIRDGVPVNVRASPNGSAHVAGDATSAQAATTQIDNQELATTTVGAYLASASLRVHAQASDGGGATNAIGFAHWYDTITFNNTSGATVELPFYWNTEGVVTDINGPVRGGQYIFSQIQLAVDNVNFSSISLKNQPGGGLGSARYLYGINGPQGVGNFEFLSGNANGQWDGRLTGPSSGLLSATLLVPTGSATIHIEALLSVDCRTGAICDFGNTSTFRFGNLPAGLSFTSESGVFLTDTGAPGAVPEPQSLVLAGLALALLARRSRRRVGVNAGTA